MGLKLLQCLSAALETFNPCLRVSSKGQCLDNIKNFPWVSGKHVPDKYFLINYLHVPVFTVFRTWRILSDEIKIGAHHDCFSWREVFLYSVFPLSPLFMWELFLFDQLPYYISCVFKINPGLLNYISNNISINVIYINNFTPQSQICHPPSQCLKVLYIPVSIRYPTVDCRDLGF